MPMADFAYYKDTYLGTAIPEKAFPGMAKRAEEALRRMQRIYQVNVPGEDSLNMAVCAMAESCYAASKRRSGVTAASVGEVSVHYGSSESADKTLQRELYEKASIYLQITRGVSQ